MVARSPLGHPTLKGANRAVDRPHGAHRCAYVLTGAVTMMLVSATLAACSHGSTKASGTTASTSSTTSTTNTPASGSPAKASTRSRVSGTAGSQGSAPPVSVSATASSTGGAPSTVVGTQPKITAARTPFSKPVSYPDGVDLAILKITQHTITDTGPGAMTGKPQTTFTVRFVNKSHRIVQLNQVVVAVTYGSARAVAPPVYDSHVADFSGSVKPGHSVQTNYAFSIPTKDLTNVTMSVDFDGLHAAATFTGRVTTK